MEGLTAIIRDGKVSITQISQLTSSVELNTVKNQAV
jgi:hypothetical protein